MTARSTRFLAAPAFLLLAPAAMAATPVVVGPVPGVVSFLPGPVIPYEKPTSRSWDEIQVPKLGGEPRSGKRWTLGGHIDDFKDDSIAGMKEVA